MTVTISSQAKDLLRKISREFDDEDVRRKNIIVGILVSKWCTKYL